METPERRRCVLFATGSGPAQRTPIFTLRPVERTVLAFLRAGVREFLITGDPEEARWAYAALQEGPCRHARVRVVENLAAAIGAGERVFLAATDVHYDRRLVVRFVEGARSEAESAVAVDYRADALAAHEGAPRAAFWPGGETLRMCGERMVGADAVLTGLALVTPGFARALVEEEPDKRSQGRALTALAQREPVKPFAVASLWQEVRDEDDVAVARRKVLAGTVGVSDGIISRYLNRPISRRITERLLSSAVKPWHISVATFVWTLGAALAFAMGHGLVGGLLAQFASVLDGVDGEVARIRYQDSPFAGVYDAILDRVGEAWLIGGMTIWAWSMGAGQSAIALGFGAVAGNSLSMLVKEKYGTQFRRRYADEHEGRARWLLLGRDGRLFLALVAGVTGQVEVVLAYLAVGTHLQAGARVLRIRSEAAGA
jgi:CDP-L-myo-inositol myo-inositolphosphotransferase